MIKRVLVVLLLVAVLVVPGSAWSKDMHEWNDTSCSGSYSPVDRIASSACAASVVYFPDVAKLPTLNYVAFTWASGSVGDEGSFPFQYTLGTETKTGTYHRDYTRNALGAVTHVRYTLFFDDWNVGALIGPQRVATNVTFYSFPGVYNVDVTSGEVGAYLGRSWYSSVAFPNIAVQSVVSSGSQWHNRLTITPEYGGNDLRVALQRVYNGDGYPSTLTVQGYSASLYSSYDVVNADLLYPNDDVHSVNVTSPFGTVYNYSRGEFLAEPGVVFVPCTINVYDADSRLPLSGAWDYYIVIQGADAVSGSGSGAFTVVNLPVTSILKPHLLYVTKEGYEMTPGFVAIDVPAGGREINIYMTPLETVAPEASSVVTFIVTDIETGTPRGSCLVNVDGVGKYAGASGTAWFVLPENTTHQWIVTAEGYWPIGGNFTLGVDDLAIPVGMTKKTSDLPRPPFPGIPGLPVIHPSLDPSGFRMQILSVPILGGLAEPLLDSIDAIGLGVNDIALSVLDVLRYPADYIVNSVVDVGDGLVETSSVYLSTSGLLLQVIGSVIHCIPAEVCGLVTFGLLLDIVRILLWGPI